MARKSALAMWRNQSSSGDFLLNRGCAAEKWWCCVLLTPGRAFHTGGDEITDKDNGESSHMDNNNNDIHTGRRTVPAALSPCGRYGLPSFQSCAQEAPHSCSARADWPCLPRWMRPSLWPAEGWSETQDLKFPMLVLQVLPLHRGWKERDSARRPDCLGARENLGGQRRLVARGGESLKQQRQWTRRRAVGCLCSCLWRRNRWKRRQQEREERRKGSGQASCACRSPSLPGWVVDSTVDTLIEMLPAKIPEARDDWLETTSVTHPVDCNKRGTRWLPDLLPV